MILALNAAMVLARRQPTILLSDAKAISNDLRKYKRNGSLLVSLIKKDEVRVRLQRLITDKAVGLLSQNSNFDLIMTPDAQRLLPDSFKTSFQIPSPI